MSRRSAGTRRGQTLKPLARKPKQLDGDPTVFEPSRGGSGMVLRSSGPRRRGAAAARGGSSDPDTTDETASLIASVELNADIDTAALDRARQIAGRLALRRPRRDVVARRGPGRLASGRYDGGSDDIDLDATLDSLVAHPVLEEDDIIVRRPVRTRRAVVLAVDVSGSMRGERIRTAAATVGALAAELSGDDLAVIAFWSDAAVLSPLGHPVVAERVLDTLLRIPARGLTNVSFPLQLARQQLARVSVRDARVLLLSDCLHNAGPDPRLAAAGIAQLDVLLDTSGQHDGDLARDLVRLGNGRLVEAHTSRDVPLALTRIFLGLSRS